MAGKTKYRTEDCEFSESIQPTVEDNLINRSFAGIETTNADVFHHEIKVKSGLSVFPTSAHSNDFADQYLQSHGGKQVAGKVEQLSKRALGFENNQFYLRDV